MHIHTSIYNYYDFPHLTATLQNAKNMYVGMPKKYATKFYCFVCVYIANHKYIGTYVFKYQQVGNKLRADKKS